MSHVERRAYCLGTPGQSLQNVLRALVRELLLEVVIVDAERQALTGATLIDALQDVAGRVSRDVARAEQRGKAHRILQVCIVFNGGRVVGRALNTPGIELRFHFGKLVGSRLAEEHELSA